MPHEKKKKKNSKCLEVMRLAFPVSRKAGRNSPDPDCCGKRVSSCQHGSKVATLLFFHHRKDSNNLPNWKLKQYDKILIHMTRYYKWHSNTRYLTNMILATHITTQNQHLKTMYNRCMLVMRVYTNWTSDTVVLGHLQMKLQALTFSIWYPNKCVL